MTSYKGRIVNVEETTLGDALDGDHASGVSVLQVFDVSWFEAPGSLSIEGDVYDYTAIDEDLNTITLSGPTSADYVDGDQVLVSPETVEKIAAVVLSDADGAVEARIAKNMQDTLDVGIREPGREEVVTVEQTVRGLTVTDWWGAPLKRDGSFIDPESTIPPAALTDGIPPATSSTPTTVGGLQQVFVRWSPTPNVDPVTYEVHLSTSNATPPVAGDPATLAEETAATFIATRVLPDGTELQFNIDGSNTDDPTLRQTYYFAVITKDADGAAAPSDWVPGQLDLTASGDIVAGSVTVELLAAVLAYFGELQIGSIDGATGAGITISPPRNDGGSLSGGIEVRNSLGVVIVRLHPEGCFIQGQLVADVLTVLTDLQILTSAELSRGAVFKLDNKVKDPTLGPTLTQDAVSLQSAPSSLPTGYFAKGMCWDATTSHWYQLIFSPTTKNTYLRKISTAGALVSQTLLARAYTPDDVLPGVAIIGSSVYWHAYIGGDGSTAVFKNALAGTAQAATGAYDVNGILFTDSTQSKIYVTSHSGGSDDITRLNTSLVQDGYAVLDASATPFGDRLGAHIGDLGFGSSKLVFFEWNPSTSVRSERVFPLPSTWTGETVTEASLQTRSLMPVTREYAFHPTYGIVTHIPGSSAFQRWSNYLVSSDATWAAKYADTKIADTPDHTTAVSPASDNITVQSRSFVTVTLPPLASGADESDVWVGYGNGATPSTFYKRSESMSGRDMVLTSLKSTSGGTTAPDPAKTLFPSGTPARLYSEAGDFEVYGDGSGQWPLLKIPATTARRTSSFAAPTSGTAITVNAYNAFDGTALPSTFYTYSAGVFTITAAGAGVYDLDAFVSWVANATGIRILYLRVNGSVVKEDTSPAVSATTETAQGVTKTGIYLAAGDTVDIRLLQNSGGSLSIQSGSYLSLKRIGALAA